MAHEPKRLDALIVDVEDSTTLLKLYVGRLVKAPTRAMFYPPLVEHSREIVVAVDALDETVDGREYLVRIARLLRELAERFNAMQTATHERILTTQEAIDLLEAQLDHMLQGESGPAPEVASSLERLERTVAEETASPVAAPQNDRAPAIEDRFEEDPFDEFALSDELLDDLMTGLDAAFAAAGGDDPVVVEAPAAAEPHRFEPEAVEPGPVTLTEAEQQGLMELFSQIATSYVGPIIDFIGKLRVGPVATSWVDLCEPAIQSMARASESMGYEPLHRELERFGRLLEETRRRSRVVDGDDRAQVLASYHRLAELLPQTFPVVDPDPNAESEAIILNSLLKQIKGVGRVTIGRLFSAGLVSLEAYYVAQPDDLAAAAGLRPSLAATICDRFKMYRDVSELASDRDIVVRRLETLVQDLRAAQFDYKKATLEEWYTHKPSRAKAKARRERQQTMWKINVALAELGELESLNALKDEIYDKRIDRLEQFVAAESARAVPRSE